MTQIIIKAKGKMSTCALPTDAKIHEEMQEDGVPGFILKVYQILEVSSRLLRNPKTKK